MSISWSPLSTKRIPAKEMDQLVHERELNNNAIIELFITTICYIGPPSKRPHLLFFFSFYFAPALQSFNSVN